MCEINKTRWSVFLCLSRNCLLEYLQTVFSVRQYSNIRIYEFMHLLYCSSHANLTFIHLKSGFEYVLVLNKILRSMRVTCYIVNRMSFLTILSDFVTFSFMMINICFCNANYLHTCIKERNKTPCYSLNNNHE